MTDTTPPNATEQPKISPFEMQVNHFIQCATSLYFNGLRASIPQAPIGMLMVKACSCLGVTVGTVLSMGNLGDILPMRGACIEAFSKGLRSVKVSPPQAEIRPPLNG